MVFTCERCGGNLRMKKRGIGVCEYCNTVQTVSTSHSDNDKETIERAEEFRRNGDFEEAISLLQPLANQNSDDPEVYWKLALCRHGIVYVEDPDSGKNFPTFYRFQNGAFTVDPDYKQALSLAGTEEKVLYTRFADEITTQQQKLIRAAQNAEHFDVFISYKETGADGNRTQDSVIAQKIYNDLEKEGIKAFFSHITLQGVLGEDYETKIYSALMSSRIMLLVGTRRENMEATWVKNEWMRFLSLMKRDNTRRLVPVVSGMKPEDLPDAVKHLKLQACDYSQLGADMDLIRSIKKVLGATGGAQGGASQTGSAPAKNFDKQLKAAFALLKAGQFDEAKKICDKIFETDPENARAYYCCFCASMLIMTPSEEDTVEAVRDRLKTIKQDSSRHIMLLERELSKFSSWKRNADFSKACSFGGESYTRKLDAIYEAVFKLYFDAVTELETQVSTHDEYSKLISLLMLLPETDEVREKISQINSKISSYDVEDTYKRLCLQAQGAVKFDECMSVSEAFDKLGYKDSEKRAKELRVRAIKIGQNEAGKLTENGHSIPNYTQACAIYKKLSDIGDAKAVKKLKAAQSRLLTLTKEMLVRSMGETPTTVENCQQAARTLRSLGFDDADKAAERYDKLAVTLATGARVKQSGRILKIVAAAIPALLFIAAYIFSILGGYLNDGMVQLIKKIPQVDKLVIFVGVFCVTGIVYGALLRMCRHRFLMSLLFIAATALYCVTTCSKGTVPVSPRMLWGVKLLPGGETSNILSLAALCAPSVILMWIAAFIPMGGKTAGWIIALILLGAGTACMLDSELMGRFSFFHRGLETWQSYALIPAAAFAGAVIFGLLGRVFRLNRLLCLLYIAFVGYFAYINTNLYWREQLISFVSTEYYPALMCLPALLVFLFRGKRS